MTSTIASSYAPVPALDVWDLVVVGGGPAGLATAIVAAERGLSVVVIERRDFPADKACGEGILPPGVRALARLGIVGRFDSQILFRLPVSALFRKTVPPLNLCRPPRDWGSAARFWFTRSPTAQKSSAQFCVIDARSTDVETKPSEALIYTSEGEVRGRLVVAADGLHSSLRKASGLEAPAGRQRRFALRQHYQLQPWTDFVEVYVDEKGEAVMTPVSNRSVNVSFAWEDGVAERPNDIYARSTLSVAGGKAQRCPIDIVSDGSRTHGARSNAPECQSDGPGRRRGGICGFDLRRRPFDSIQLRTHARRAPRRDLKCGATRESMQAYNVKRAGSIVATGS